MALNRTRRTTLLFAALVAALGLTLGGSPATAAPAAPADDAGVLYTVAPPCIERWSHDHISYKEVHLRNFCGGTRYVKVVIAYGPDSGCIRLDDGGGYTWWWSVGWPYAASRLDRVELC